MNTSRVKAVRHRAAVWVAVLSAAAGGASAAPTDIPNEFIVRMRAGFAIEALVADYSAQILKESATGLYLIRTPLGTDDAEIEATLEADPRVSMAEHNRLEAPPEGGSRSFLLRVQPPDFEQQPARAMLGLPQAQALNRGAGVTVAVLDTGVAWRGALVPMLRGDGFNFIDNNDDTSEVEMGLDTSGDGVIDGDYGHGTMVANLIAMVAPEAHILPIKVLDSDGVGSSFTLADGIRWAMQRHADVINLSLASPDNSAFVQEAIQDARGQGIVIVAAVGNQGLSAPFYPAALPGVVAVAATDSADHLASFSDFGGYVAVCAPGVDVVSLDADGFYASGSGTSFAAPLVSGLAALLQSVYVDASPSSVRNGITQQAVNIDALNPGMAGMLGAGRVDAAAALQATIGHDGCRPDFNRDGHLNPDDLGDYITEYFNPATHEYIDYNADGVVNPDDLGDYITAYFGASCGI